MHLLILSFGRLEEITFLCEVGRTFAISKGFQVLINSFGRLEKTVFSDVETFLSIRVSRVSSGDGFIWSS